MNRAEKDVALHIQSAQSSLEHLEALRKKFGQGVFLNLLLKFKMLYGRVLLWTKRNELRTSVDTVRNWTDASLLLSAGDVFYAIEDFDYALSSFKRVINEQKEPNQDVRLRALMGRIECELILAFSRPRDPLNDIGYASVTRELYSAIKQDIDLTSPEVKAELKSRLAIADLNIGVLATEEEVSRYRHLYSSRL